MAPGLDIGVPQIDQDLARVFVAASGLPLGRGVRLSPEVWKAGDECGQALAIPALPILLLPPLAIPGSLLGQRKKLPGGASWNAVPGPGKDWKPGSKRTILDPGRAHTGTSRTTGPGEQITRSGYSE